MGIARASFAAALALALVDVAWAGTLVATDFTRQALGWQLNGAARLLTVSGDRFPRVLSLTQNKVGQRGTAWTYLTFRVPDFSFIADVRVRMDPIAEGACPADGFTLAFSPTEATSLGGPYGGDLALFGGPLTFTALEVNTWYGQGLGTDEKIDCAYGLHETIAFDVIRPGTRSNREAGGGTAELGGPKIGQTLFPPGMTIVNGGMYRYQWNVAESGDMTVYVTGLDPANQHVQKVKVVEVKGIRYAVPFEGRFGLTAATGGAVQFTEVAAARIESPMIDP